ncbi:uncharacterized protein F5147DRAFT_746092 [Suillus discolor]|uniref:CxC2-like cysteine cluster KDZ transposase-associated domain-containing protein n=1 Tax=Suillus discolor TaxID=1912936 RepID=A0A9P7JSU3_9AGAM|nr:uncharacterized protein F5147DRAFT_746092 [Suillus discolor]KAG2106954.1 hypothetical protein F5147DRAFT_746092 [Suillus discolor]
MFCHQCMLDTHVYHPLHRIEMWNGTFFQHTTLKKLGLRIQLSHTQGERCYNPHPSAGDDFIVISVHGVHEVALEFCGCTSAQWYPATISEPHTAATFRVLQHFHLLSFESKVSTYEFYHSLTKYSDNTSLSAIKDRYSTFMRMVHEWQNLKQLRRVGRGHDPAGVSATAEGELTILCPACPQPGKNLPPNWEKEPLFIRWKYALFVAIDANFRLKRKAVSSNIANPSLNTGGAYFVEERAYKSYLADHSGDKQERSMCVSHNVVNMADTKSSHGLAATGVGTIDYARHEMKLANSIGDLQREEWYINMDYIMFSALLTFTASIVNISYDIACQWHKKLWTRMETIPKRLHPPCDSIIIRYFVPKFHIQAHVNKCCTNFSFNCTREMGPGTRRDTLDDHFGDWNWKKITALGERFSSVKWTKEHSEALTEAWEADNSSPNPFESQFTHKLHCTSFLLVTQAAMCLHFTELNAQELQTGVHLSLHADILLSGLITSGMDLEDQQACLKSELANVSLHATDKQKATTQTQITSLQRRLDAWAHIQELYMPVVSQLRHRSSEASRTMHELKPEDFNLWFPSQLPIHVPCDKKLVEYEWELHYAQALDALNELHSHLRLRSHMYMYKDKNIHGQVANTHANQIIEAVESRKCACNTLLSLSCHLQKSNWEAVMRPLLDSDVKPMGDMEQQGTGRIYWIWLDSHADNSCMEDKHVQDCVCLEWCKAHACAHRWSEEVELLLEEMRRVLAFLTWQAEWWKERSSLRMLDSPSTQEGLMAYACCQSALRLSLVSSFQELWSGRARQQAQLLLLMLLHMLYN